MSTCKIERTIAAILASREPRDPAPAAPPPGGDSRLPLDPHAKKAAIRSHVGSKPGSTVAVWARSGGVVLARLPAAAQRAGGAHRFHSAARGPRGLVPARAARHRAGEPAHAAAGRVRRALARAHA